MTDFRPSAACHHEKGLAWRMCPRVDLVRRVRLCRKCGRTVTARLALTGEARFDALAERAVRHG